MNNINDINNIDDGVFFCYRYKTKKYYIHQYHIFEEHTYKHKLPLDFLNALLAVKNQYKELNILYNLDEICDCYIEMKYRAYVKVAPTVYQDEADRNAYDLQIIFFYALEKNHESLKKIIKDFFLSKKIKGQDDE